MIVHMFDTAGVVDDETGSVTGSGSGSAGLDGLGVVGELIARAAVADAGVVVDDDLVATAVRLGMIRRFLDATEAHVLAELDARGTTVVTEGATTAAWYAQHSGVATAIAAKRVRVATRLRDPLCAVDAALSRGRISWDHAAVICAVANPRIIDDIASIQDLLIDLAHGATFERYAADIRAIAERIDVDGGHNPRDDDSTNELHFDVLPGGTLIGGTLVGDIEQSIITAVEAETDRLHRELSAEHGTTRGAVEIPKRSTLRAMALAELCRAGRAADPSTSVAPVPDVTLVIHADDPFAALTQTRQRLAQSAAAVLCCDPAIHTLLVDSLGVPLDLGHEVRYANRNQRRALRQRDGGCVFPGCGAHANWTDAHHINPWRPDGTGGPTDMANMALLCRRHHRVVHRPAWTMTAQPNGWFTITTPTGTTLHSQRHQRAGPAPPE